MTPTRAIFPEVAVARDDNPPISGWRIEEGSSRRGEASCDFGRRVLRVPLGNDDLDRTVRMHELLHLRLSPHRTDVDVSTFDSSTRSRECAEELRINWLLGEVGCDPAILKDGSERFSGQRAGELGNWPEVVYFYAALIGTGGERDFIAGVRKAQPDWARALSPLRRELAEILSRTPLRDITSTTPTESGLPEGYATVTLALARLLDRAAGAAAPRNSDDVKRIKRSLLAGGRRAPSGRFADLVIDGDLTYEPIRSRVGSRGSTYQVSGRECRDPSRVWRDPTQRIFRHRAKRGGGVVLVDQSGSMDLSNEELDALLRVVPGVTILGYSHRPGDLSGRPNAWVLADCSRRVTESPRGNVGNGVDGPALEWAARRAQARDTIVWITDGQVTDSNDHPSEELSAHCADLVRRHRVVLARNLEEATLHLGRGQKITRKLGDFGRLGRALTHSAVVS